MVDVNRAHATQQVGIQFDALAPDLQGRLDRVVFAFMRAMAHEQRHLVGSERSKAAEAEASGSNRRGAYRVEPAVNVPHARVMLADRSRSHSPSVAGHLVELSCSGCSITCRWNELIAVDRWVDVHLVSGAEQFTLPGRIMHVHEPPAVPPRLPLITLRHAAP